MKIQELVCDHCGKHEKGGEYHYGLPKDWYVIGYHCQSYLACDDWRIMYHFCCFDCLCAEIKVAGKEIRAKYQV